MSIRVDSESSDQLRFRPCCHYQQDQPHASLDQYLSSHQLSRLQRHMLVENHLPENCAHCAGQESIGLPSTRTMALTEITDRPTRTKITALEIFPSNICNLLCIMCDQKHSSRVAQERVALGWIDTYQLINNEDATIELLSDCGHVNTVSFIGGEFFLTKRNIEILDILQQKGIRTKIVTNATVLTKHHVQKLKLIRDLDIMISMDGTHAAYEFIRHPANWSTVAQNTKILLDELPHAKIHLYALIQPLNLSNIVHLLDFANQTRIQMQLVGLEHPDWLTWPILTGLERSKLVDQVHVQLCDTRVSTSQKHMLESLLDHVLRTAYQPLLRQQFQEKILQICQHRQIDHAVVERLMQINLQT